MASELRVNTLKDAAGNNSIATSFVAGGSAKAWVNFNGSGTIAIRDSFSTSSITDTATGNTTVTISAAMNNANNYATVGNSGNGGTNPGNAFTSSNGITSTTGHHETMDDSASNSDREHNSLIFHGDLA